MVEAESEGGNGRQFSRGKRWGLLVAAVLLGAAVAAGLRVRALLAPPPARPQPVADVSSERLIGPGGVVGFADAYETQRVLAAALQSAENRCAVALDEVR